MNNLTFDELVAREYRRERMAEAEKYRKQIRPITQSFKTQFCRRMATIGMRLENMGAKMQQYFQRAESKAIASTK